MELQRITDRFSGITVNIVTTNANAALATGEVIDGVIAGSLIAVKLTAPYANYPTGATVFFNVNQIVAIG